jgi:NAD(P)H-nitrite reductase large subunit
MVTEKELVDAIREGAHTLEEIREKTRATTGCGTCTMQVYHILQRELKISPLGKPNEVID